MTERIEKDLGIPLTEVTKFNVKGEVLIYKKNGDIAKIPLQEAMDDYQRPECHHCGDFSAEMADIACGGVGTEQATIVVIRTKRGEEIWKEYEKSGEVEVESIADNKRAWNILLRLARRQRDRVPLGPERSGTTSGLEQYNKDKAVGNIRSFLSDSGKDSQAIDELFQAAYGDDKESSEEVRFIAGQSIPNDPGINDEGKRKLPPPLTRYEGGDSPR
jgi:coenzyme F420 hydrogenase subunit beta